MSRTIPTPLLALAALFAISLDLAVVSPLAGASGEGEAATPMPDSIPRTAFLTGAVVEKTQIDEVGISVTRGENGAYTLVFSNTTAVGRTLSLKVEVYETLGSLVSRMGPARILSASEQVLVNVPARGTLEKTLGYSGKTQERTDGTDFQTTEFFLTSTGTGDEPSTTPPKVLRVPQVDGWFGR